MKKKHKITLFVIGILLALSLMLSSSYALWVFNVSQESTNVVVSDCFEIAFVEGTQAIHLTNSFPMKDSKGVYTPLYNFTLTNICEHAADISINVETLNDSEIDGENLRVDVNGHIHTYGDGNSVEPTLENASSAASFYNDTIAAGDSKSYNLRLWIKEDADNEDVLNKSFSSKITVRSTLRKNYSESFLARGYNFNDKIKKLAGTSGYNSSDTVVKSIVWSNTIPDENDEVINVSSDENSIPIYVWIKDGVVYLYSEADKIYLNENSRGLFHYFKSLESIDMSRFDTSRVEDMSWMFNGCESLETLDLRNFDTSNVKNMQTMFQSAKKLEVLDLSNFDTSKVTDIGNMFGGLNNMINLDLKNFNTLIVNNMEGMFSNCQSISDCGERNQSFSELCEGFLKQGKLLSPHRQAGYPEDTACRQ